MNRRYSYIGAAILSTLGAFVGCSGTAELQRKLDDVAAVNSQQATELRRLRQDNEKLLGFYNQYSARLDARPENLAAHEFEELLRYAAIRIELLTLRRMITDEQTTRATGDTAAITTANSYTNTRLTELETRIREYQRVETKGRTDADAATNATLGTQNTTITDLRTRLERAEAAILDIQRAEERRALDAASREGRK